MTVFAPGTTAEKLAGLRAGICRQRIGDSGQFFPDHRWCGGIGHVMSKEKADELGIKPIAKLKLLHHSGMPCG